MDSIAHFPPGPLAEVPRRRDPPALPGGWGRRWGGSTPGRPPRTPAGTLPDAGAEPAMQRRGPRGPFPGLFDFPKSPYLK